MLKYAEINILDITVEHLDITIEDIRWLLHSWKSIFLRVLIQQFLAKQKTVTMPQPPYFPDLTPLWLSYFPYSNEHSKDNFFQL